MPAPLQYGGRSPFPRVLDSRIDFVVFNRNSGTAPCPRKSVGIPAATTILTCVVLVNNQQHSPCGGSPVQVADVLMQHFHSAAYMTLAIASGLMPSSLRPSSINAGPKARAHTSSEQSPSRS